MAVEGNGIDNDDPRRRGTWKGRTMRFSVTRRGLQITLGLIWLLDGALQFQSFMYSHGFIEMLTGMAPGQPGWLGSSINWGAHMAEHNLTVWNTLFALVQCLIGVGLLYRRTVKPALIASFGWVLVVWWFGEAFGMLFMNMSGPLTGAPGAALLYAFVGVIGWPSERAAGLLDARGARMLWAGLWLAMAWLWLEAASSSANATASALKGAPSGMGWLSSVQHWVGKGAQGNGLPIAIVLALASVAIAVGVGTDRWARPLLWLAIALNLLYWVLGQGFGGIFAGGATDPNAGPLFILLAVAMFPLVGVGERAPARVQEPTPTPAVLGGSLKPRSA